MHYAGQGLTRVPRSGSVAEALGGGYCQSQMPLKLAVRDSLAGHSPGHPGGVG